MSDEKKNDMTRTTIEKILAPAISEAITTGGLPTDLDTTRRLCRALCHLGVRRLLAAGASQQTVVEQVGEALVKELAKHKKHAGGEAGVPLALA